MVTSLYDVSEVIGMDEIGNRIRMIRKEKNITQEDLANRLGLTKAAVSKYELGQRSPSLEQITKIAIALGVDTGTLIGYQGFDTVEEFKKAREAATKNPGEEVKVSYGADGTRTITANGKTTIIVDGRVIDSPEDHLVTTFRTLDEGDQAHLIKTGDVLAAQSKYQKKDGSQE